MPTDSTPPEKRLSQAELEALLQRLSRAQEAGDDGVPLQDVQDILTQSGLEETFFKEVFEEQARQKSKEVKRRQQKRSLITIGALLAVFIPLSILGGYKGREAMARFSPLNPEVEDLRAQLTEKESDIKALEEDKEKLDEEVQAQEERIDNLIEQIGISDPGSEIDNDEAKSDEDTAESSNPKELPAGPPTTVGEVGADTPAGSVLKPGETWVQGGIVMTLTDPSVKSKCDNRLVQFNLTYSNFSGKEQIARLSGSDIAIDVDGEFSSNYAWSYNAAARNNCKTDYRDRPNSSAVNLKFLDIEKLKHGQTVELYLTFFGKLNSYDQDIHFHLEEAGPIQRAKWVINTPRE